VAEGDWVVHHWTATATHTGEFMGIPATGRRFTAAGIVITRIADGKIAEQWRIVDVFGMMQQLGALPAPPEAAS
jgi:predicted ester cyclase